jgi:hypothetical protein
VAYLMVLRRDLGQICYQAFDFDRLCIATTTCASGDPATFTCPPLEQKPPGTPCLNLGSCAPSPGGTRALRLAWLRERCALTDVVPQTPTRDADPSANVSRQQLALAKAQTNAVCAVSTIRLRLRFLSVLVGSIGLT